ncbi:MFS transporter [Galbitalea sp. SE-J8]|uniref:MFS transporter n=1 Tax=Galbitalea sp. SE-J8 TaxID=3054952 RepID=UPI00259C7307|nr:MFS transporter [Galbitalea sp. SE-J8]MDM4762806.1 MFS transporter [Galbitalea sp. SE-J8]
MTPSSRRTFLALAFTVLTFATLQSLLVPVLPTIQADLKTDAAGVTWTVTSWLITAAVATPLLGRVGDLVGKRRVFLISVAAVAAGSIVAAFAPTLSVLIVARVVQGLGGAMFPLAFGLLRDALPASALPAGIGGVSAMTAIGSGLGTVLAGPLSAAIGWRGLFLIPIVGMAVGAVLTVRWVPATGERAEGRVNVPAAVLLSAWLVALLLPLSTGPQWGWGSPVVIGLFVAAAVLIAAWVIVEVRSRMPLVDLRMLRDPAVWSTDIAALFFGAAMFGVFAYFPRFLQTPVETGYGLGLTVGASGLVMVPMLVTMATMGFVAGPVSRVLPPRAQLVVAALLIALATASIALAHGLVATLALSAALFGIGLGMGFAAMTTIVVQSVPSTQTGVASGVNANLRTIGSAIGTALLTAIVTGSADAAGDPSELGYEQGFLTLAALALVAAIVVAAARIRPRRRVAPVPTGLAG